MPKKFSGTDAIKVNKALRRLFPEEIGDIWIEQVVGSSCWSDDSFALNKALANPIWDLLNRGGKRWRPRLMELCCQAVGGKKEDVKDLLAVVEIIHNGTLLLDDIEDSSPVRRGKKAVHLLHGQDVAINAGCFMYFLPYVDIRNLNDAMRLHVYDIINEEMMKLHIGQAMDIYWHGGGKMPDSSKYLRMCQLKTGVLARMSARLGALAGAATKQQTQALSMFAESIGVAFQIIDDILNVCPGENWGKETGEDITEGKITLLVIHAVKKAGKSDREYLLNKIASHTGDLTEIKKCISILLSTGSVDYARDVAENIVSKAWEVLNPVIAESKAKQELKKFAIYLIDRNI